MLTSSIRRSLCATLVVLTACSSTSPTSNPTTSPTSAASAPASPTPADETDVSSSTPSMGDLPTEPAGPTIPVIVYGSPLPERVTSGYIDRGGQLLQTSDVWNELGVHDMPFPQAPGSYLTVVESIIELESPGVVSRNEGFGWLFEDPRTLGELLDEFAGTVAIIAGGWSNTTTESTQSGAECVERLYTNPASQVTWTLSGCSYPQFSDMRALQVRRKGTFSSPGISVPAMLTQRAAAAAATAAAVGAQVTGWSVTVSEPDASGTTMTTTVTFTPDVDQAAVEAALRASLQGWTEHDDNEDQGNSWTSGNDTWEISLDGRTVALRQTGRVAQ